MALRVQNKNPYLIGGNPTGSAYVPVSYGDFVEIDSSKVAVPSTTTPTFTYSGGMNGNGVVTVNNGNSSQVGSNASSITYAEGTNNYGAGTGNYITPSQTVDTTYTQALGAVIPTSTPTNDYTPYNGGGGTIVLDTKTGETKVVDNGTGGTGLPEGVKPVQVTPTIGTPPEDIDPNKATLDQYYKYMYETGLANAEKAKQQAIINAKGQYNEFINPYGVQAEQQARMGLMGGGYSEYLKGKAYEGMIDTQNQARSDYAKTQQSLYSDYMGNMAAYNQAKQDKVDAGNAAKADLLNNISKYSSEEALGAALDALGITDATERQTYIDAWTKWMTENDAKEFGAKNVAMSTYISGESSDGAPKSRDDVYNYAMRLGLNNEQANEWVSKWEAGEYYLDFDNFDSWTKKEQDDFFAPENFNRLSPQQQTDIQNRYSAKENPMALFGEDVLLSPDDAKSVLETVLNSNRYSQEFKDAAQKRYNQLYSVDAVIKAREFVGENKVKDNASVIVPKSDGSYNLLDFGKFKDSGTGKGEQDKYLNAILDSTKDGAQNPIAEGQVVIVNYGHNEGEIDAFVYVGNGIFVKVSAADANINNLYIPKGYNKKTDGKNIAIVKDNTTN
jgi:hypothetical protein